MVFFQCFHSVVFMHLEKDILGRGQKKKKAYLCKSVSGKDSGDLYLPWTKAHTGAAKLKHRKRSSPLYAQCLFFLFFLGGGGEIDLQLGLTSICLDFNGNVDYSLFSCLS